MPLPSHFMISLITNKYEKLDWRTDGRLKPFVSRKYARPGSDVITHDLRCDICGKWYNYCTKDIPLIQSQDRWNTRKNRPFHCNNSLCQDYHQREMVHKMKQIDKMLKGQPVDSQVL